MIGVHDGKIWRMLDLYVHQARLSENYQDVSAVGMDETSIAKGHDYISLFVDLERKKTIFVGDGKGAEVVKEFAEDFAEHGGKTEQIKDVSCDMSPAFIKGVAENLPNAEVTFDRFHIMNSPYASFSLTKN